MTAEEGDYHPDAIASGDIDVTAGTRITLTDLLPSPTESTVVYLRRRLARRFSIIGPENKFLVKVNGQEIGVTDRDFYKKIEYLWSLGRRGGQVREFCVKAR